ncbi:TMEM175 family protein [Alteromonas sp. ASW11-36]|uniref:TMEM175 family protein n=1 Tax=Alteromonas arenosi TaxID=3055817 RepID=A0ABT7SSZ1_9ALTE|nr:TMEM175 family protein [Alteromonas sp. ASW11-36]MDM7859290.1 TMEM175 family protein [Alteromonas sp. ASW11-36]
MTQTAKQPPIRLRGEAMTRIETFVAASFAFAITMLVISLDEIPNNIDDFVIAVKNIPSFVASCALIFWVWHSHATWSRQYGLEDNRTIVLSGLLVCIVLVYIYPLRLMMQGLFMSISGGYFPFELQIREYWELRFVFAFYAIGFILLSVNFMGLFQHALDCADEIELTDRERFETKTYQLHWGVNAAVCSLALIFALALPERLMPYSPYVYATLWPFSMWLNRHRDNKWQSISTAQEE